MQHLFYKQIEASTAHRPVRDRLCGEVLFNPSLFSILLATALDCNDKNHYKACWILELVLENNIVWLQEHLDDFTLCLSRYTHEGAIRSISKICMFCAMRHHKFKNTFLNEAQQQRIIEVCFDWLITDTKVASKAYAMRALYMFGKHQSWIHEELKPILTQGFPDHSPAYKGAARDILKKIG